MLDLRLSIDTPRPMAKRAQAVKASANNVEIGAHRFLAWGRRIRPRQFQPTSRAPSDSGSRGERVSSVEETDPLGSRWGSSSCISTAAGNMIDRDEHGRDRCGNNRGRRKWRVGPEERRIRCLSSRRPSLIAAGAGGSPPKRTVSTRSRSTGGNHRRTPSESATPADSRRLLRDRDDQQRRHRDVIGEVDQGVGQIARPHSQGRRRAIR